MSIAYPLPRGTREVTYQAGLGQTVYGPVPFVIWDIADVSVRITNPGDDFAATLDPSQYTVTPAVPASARCRPRTHRHARRGAGAERDR
ncbi:hypothetical protein P0R31_03260 [Bradyrhizobium yuanmingense]|uniref:hypothetical protein n=1 Tax=Bradyrhizobium yuanmingense TaxID=108015 RepID=UPI0023B9EB61|nr:hypothetical protein [Bradyrhizobium yuanmingense]MDF0516258.1 hypothetical protein [Bradyrhizobium yuanmingense]